MPVAASISSGSWPSVSTKERAMTANRSAFLKRSTSMQQPGLQGPHRDKIGEISRKHGNTLVSTLRKIYGPSFAPAAQPSEQLSDVLVEMDEPSLTKLVHDHERGDLEGKVAAA
jgi:hypothetical protein